MDRDPLLSTLLDLDLALPGIELILGGGYGLYLKQQYLAKTPQIRTLFAVSQLPVARTTEDIDLILRADIVTASEQMGRIRKAFDDLQFTVIETAKYCQFSRELDVGRIKIDLLAAPLGSFASLVPKDSRRVKPQPSVKLHASKLEEALGVEQGTLRIPISGLNSQGQSHSTEVLIPQTLSYLLMKLHAFSDRHGDGNKDFGRHHALDIYRIVGLLTKDEDKLVAKLRDEFSTHPMMLAAHQIVREHFSDRTALGLLRIQEHQLYSPEFDLEKFAAELRNLLGIR